MTVSSSSRDQRIAELAAIFEKIGANDPLGWARSEIQEDIPQLARYVFLRAAWQNVQSEDDTTWIDQEIDYHRDRPTIPGAGIAPPLQRCLDLGISRQDLTDIVRIKQWQLLFRFCYLLEDPGDLEEEVGNLAWVLVELRDDEPTGRWVGGLHEMVLAMDPTGREMRPRE